MAMWSPGVCVEHGTHCVVVVEAGKEAVGEGRLQTRRL